MTLLERLFRIPQPTDFTLSPQIEAWTDNSHLYDVLGTDLFGTVIDTLTRTGAMRVPAVARARHLIAGAISGLPLKVLKGADEVTPQPYWCYGTDGQLGDVATTDAIRWGLSVQSPWYRQLWTADDLLFHGESLWLATRLDPTGRPARAVRVPYDAWLVEDGRVVDTDSQPFPAAQVIYIPGPHEGILNFAAGTVRAAADLEYVAADVARHPFRLELHQISGTTLDADERRELVEEARAALADNTGVLFTNPAVETKDHRFDTANELVIAGRNAAALDIARHVSMPAAMVDATTEGASLEYQTLEGRNQQWLDYGLTLYMDAIAARLSMDDIVPAGSRVALDTSAFTTTTAPTTGAPTED